MQGDSQSYKSYLTLTNVSQGNVAYKVKTTTPRFYVVKPNQGIIERGQKITIDITLIPSPVKLQLSKNMLINFDIGKQN